MNTALKPMYEWKTIPWKKVERQVFKLQKRIYQASLCDDRKTVHKLQRLLMKSWYARLLATRRVTQDNQGKKTPGIDGIVVLTPKERIKLAESLDFKQKPEPVRRVYIPKPGQSEKRLLGIPVIRDRALQAVVKQVIEPEWEAKFEANSYGFRPGRGCHDAIQAIFTGIVHQPKYVLDADIAKCFDMIDHQPLLNKLQTFSKMRTIIKQWLKAGIIDKNVLQKTDTGTQQGSVVSPVLANIALHGLETAIVSNTSKWAIIDDRKVSWTPKVIRYADDFVVLHRDLQVVEQLKQRISDWLADMGLTLKLEKTQITHTLQEPLRAKPGFDFLGFNIRQYPVGRSNIDQEQINFKTFIKPSKKGVQRHLDRLREVIDNHKSDGQDKLINTLNPIIRGWCNYYSTVVSKEVFSKANYATFQMLWAWAKRRHPDKSKRWIYCRYWKRWNGKIEFKADNTDKLLNHHETPIRRHIKVQGNRSPYDGDWVYWATRMGRHPEISDKLAGLLKKQQGLCVHCGLYFKEEDRLSIAIKKIALSGKNRYRMESKLLHKHCHDKKTKTYLR